MMSITLGLISDTHMPDRWLALPPTIPEIFDGVDLILHSGDVGERWVLDQLGEIAPVVAVHGNDELADAPQYLPYQQVIHVEGQRILLTHSHHPDHAEEMAFRRTNDWHVRLAWLAGRAREAGASILVYGHSHVPWMVEFDGVWLVNPGAIAAGGHMRRQTVQTVARLTVLRNGSPRIAYFDVNDPAQPVHIHVDLNASFQVAFAQFSESIATPDLEANNDWLYENIYTRAPEPVLDALRRVMYRCLSGEIEHMSTQNVVDEILASPDISDVVKHTLRAWWQPT
jgi:putative phosphoesterase